MTIYSILCGAILTKHSKIRIASGLVMKIREEKRTKYQALRFTFYL